MITEYFRIQIKRSNRHLQEFGVYPVFGYTLGAIVFWGMSEYLFYKLPYAAYFYFGIFTSIIIWIDNPDRIDFLKCTFSSKQYLIIRVFEKIIIALPFAVFLLYKVHVLLVILSLILAIILALLPPIQYQDRTLPTPFSYHPFEFAIGIRKSYWLYFSLFFILFMAIRVDNFNLGIATLLATIVISISFYATLEGEDYIWNFSGSSYSFIKKKLIYALVHVSVLSFPILGLLLITWPSKYLYILGLVVIGYLYLITFILAKYSAYPRIMSLPQGLILVFSLWLPPLLLIIIPYLLHQSNRKLKSLLT